MREGFKGVHRLLGTSGGKIESGLEGSGCKIEGAEELAVQGGLRLFRYWVLSEITWSSEKTSNLAPDRCPKIWAREALYRAAVVQRLGEKGPIRERNRRKRPPLGPEVLAKTTPTSGLLDRRQGPEN